MFCPKCGATLPDGADKCTQCGASVNNLNINTTTNVKNKKKFFRSPSNGSKSYAAIFSAVLVFPASICVAIDLAFQSVSGWSGYVVGALAVLWVCAVFPALKVTPPFVTAVVCACSVVGYIFYIAGKTGHFEWLYKCALPIFILTVGFIAIDAAFIGGGQIKGFHIASLICAEIAIYLMAIEATADFNAVGEIHLRWSIITSCVFVSAIALAEAFNYVGKINKK